MYEKKRRERIRGDEEDEITIIKRESEEEKKGERRICITKEGTKEGRGGM